MTPKLVASSALRIDGLDRRSAARVTIRLSRNLIHPRAAKRQAIPPSRRAMAERRASSLHIRYIRTIRGQQLHRTHNPLCHFIRLHLPA